MCEWGSLKAGNDLCLSCNVIVCNTLIENSQGKWRRRLVLLGFLEKKCTKNVQKKGHFLQKSCIFF